MNQQNIRTPEGIWLQPSFYFGTALSERETFKRFISILIELDGKFGGAARVLHVGDAAKLPPYPQSPPETMQAENRTLSLLELYELLDAGVVFPWEILMYNAVGVVETSTAEIITHVGVPPEFAAAEQHPIAIFTEADRIYDSETGVTNDALGREFYKRFIEIAEKSQPLYAAVPVEYPMETPTELRHKKHSLAFNSFYVNERYVGEQNIEKLKRLYSGAHVELLDTGIFISCSRLLNTDGKASNPKDVEQEALGIISNSTLG